MTDRPEPLQKILLRHTEDLLFPRRCPVCDRPVRPFGADICPECAPKLEKIHGPVCRKCGKMLPDEREEYCTDCSRNRHLFSSGVSTFTYRSASGAIYRYKYEGRQEYAGFFSRAMAERLGMQIREGTLAVPGLLLPVPLSRERMKKRGYNQAALLAEGISRMTGIPWDGNTLRREINTLPMKNMSFADRRSNLKKAFNVYGIDVKSKMIMVIDDIYTTGATADACTEVLLRAGAAYVSFMTLAIGIQSGNPGYD